jgi:outer membrane lipoprotein-sorting protein
MALAIACAFAPATTGTATAGSNTPHPDRLPLLDKLLDSFRGVGGIEAHFREEKRIALLKAPLVSEGQLYFLAPDRLARRVATPSPSVMVVTGTSVSFQDSAGHAEALSLDQNPVARLFVDSFLKILAGDAAALSRIYGMTATSGPNGIWTLQLKPTAAPLNRLIDEIDLSGRGAIMDRLRVLEVGGDETVTRFTSVDIHRRFGAEEERRLFTIGPP